MSKNDMLAPIVRALVCVPQERLGVLFDAINKVGGASGELWRTRFAEVLREGVKAVILAPEAPLNTFIHVDRSIRPVYPDFVKAVMHLKLERIGPVEYGLGTIDPWLHEDQRNGRYMEGYKLYEYLKEEKMLWDCLSLRDSEEIRKKGLAVFRQFFGGQTVFFWKSVVQHYDGDLFVPYLTGVDNGMMEGWRWLGDRWGKRSALRFVN